MDRKVLEVSSLSLSFSDYLPTYLSIYYVSTLHTPHFTLHTPHSRLHAPHSTLYTLHFTLHTLHFTLCTLHSTLYTLEFTLNTSHSTLYTPHSTLYTPHSTLCTLHSALYTLDSTLHTWHSTLCTLHSTLYTLRSGLHTLHYTWHSTLYTPYFTLQSLHSTLHTSHATFFHIPQSTVHWYGNRGKMCKTVQINWVRKVFCVTAYPCVSTSVPLTYVWAFGFVGCILFIPFSRWSNHLKLPQTAQGGQPEHPATLADAILANDADPLRRCKRRLQETWATQKWHGINGKIIYNWRIQWQNNL